MREIKITYKLRKIKTGEMYPVVFTKTIEEIESGVLKTIMNDEYEIVTRDLFIGTPQ